MLRANFLAAFLVMFLGSATLYGAGIDVKTFPSFANQQVMFGSPPAQSSDISNVYRDGVSESRVVYEWALPALPAGSTVTGVNYNGFVSSLQAAPPTYANLSFHGYIGNGSFSASDASVPFNSIGQSGPITTGGSQTFALTTSYVQSLALASKPYLGTMLYAEQTGLVAGLLRPGNTPSNLPNLELIATVPDIGTVHAKPLYDVLATLSGSTFVLTDGASAVNTQFFPAASVDRRGLLAFDLRGIPNGATITSATLTFHVNAISSSGSDFPQPRAYARFDNGLPEASDATFGVLAGTSDPVTTTGTNISIPLTTSTLQNIFNAGGFMGFTILGSANNQQFGFDTTELSLDAAPSLDVSYSVPEPATLALLLPSLMLFRPRRSRR